MDFLRKNSITTQIVIASSKLEAFANEFILKPHNLTVVGLKILNFLNSVKNETPTGIMLALGSSKSNITQRLNLLEKNGYVKRLLPPEAADRRKVVIELTDDGRKKLEDALRAINEKSIDLEVFFSGPDLKKHSAFLEKIIELLDGCGKSNNKINNLI